MEPKLGALNNLLRLPSSSVLQKNSVPLGRSMGSSMGSSAEIEVPPPGAAQRPKPAAAPPAKQAPAGQVERTAVDHYITVAAGFLIEAALADSKNLRALRVLHDNTSSLPRVDLPEVHGTMTDDEKSSVEKQLSVFFPALLRARVSGKRIKNTKDQYRALCDVLDQFGVDREVLKPPKKIEESPYLDVPPKVIKAWYTRATKDSSARKPKASSLKTLGASDSPKARDAISRSLRDGERASKRARDGERADKRAANASKEVEMSDAESGSDSDSDSDSSSSSDSQSDPGSEPSDIDIDDPTVKKALGVENNVSEDEEEDEDEDEESDDEEEDEEDDRDPHAKWISDVARYMARTMPPLEDSKEVEELRYQNVTLKNEIETVHMEATAEKDAVLSELQEVKKQLVDCETKVAERDQQIAAIETKLEKQKKQMMALLAIE